MPNYTKTINLEKPLQTETYDVDKRNANWDKIDEAIKKDRKDADTHAVDPDAHANGIAGNAASATKLKKKFKIGIKGKVYASSVWVDGLDDADIEITKVLEAEKAIKDQNNNPIDSTYLQLTGGTLTGIVTNEAVYVKTAKSIGATEIGDDENEEPVILVQDKNGVTVGQINTERNKKHKNNQLRSRVVNKGWSDLRLIQNDNGNYWVELAGGPNTTLYIPNNDNSTKIPTTAWVRGANVESANRLETARTIKLVGDASGSVSFDGTADVSINTRINKSWNSAYSGKYTEVNTPICTLPNSWQEMYVVYAMSNNKAGTDLQGRMPSGIYCRGQINTLMNIEGAGGTLELSLKVNNDNTVILVNRGNQNDGFIWEVWFR